jgi:hypothetical protein
MADLTGQQCTPHSVQCMRRWLSRVKRKGTERNTVKFPLSTCANNSCTLPTLNVGTRSGRQTIWKTLAQEETTRLVYIPNVHYRVQSTPPVEQVSFTPQLPFNIILPPTLIYSLPIYQLKFCSICFQRPPTRATCPANVHLLDLVKLPAIITTDVPYP